MQLWGLVEAVQASHAADEALLIRTVAVSCLVNGHDDTVKTHLQLVPVSSAHIEFELKNMFPDKTGKLVPQLQADDLKPYFKLIFGPKGTKPAVIPILSALLEKQHRTADVKQALTTMVITQTLVQPVSVADDSDGHIFLSCSAQNIQDAELNACKVSNRIVHTAHCVMAQGAHSCCSILHACLMVTCSVNVMYVMSRKRMLCTSGTQQVLTMFVYPAAGWRL